MACGASIAQCRQMQNSCIAPNRRVTSDNNYPSLIGDTTSVCKGGPVGSPAPVKVRSLHIHHVNAPQLLPLLQSSPSTQDLMNPVARPPQGASEALYGQIRPRAPEKKRRYQIQERLFGLQEETEEGIDSHD